MTCCVFLFYPETKGYSLEEMDEIFKGSVFAFRAKNIVVTHSIGNEEKAASVDAKE